MVPNATAAQFMVQTAQGGPTNLFDLGKRDAREYMTHYLSDCVGQYSLDVLRLDYNIDPAALWLGQDQHNRSGVTEVRRLQGV